MSDSTLDLDAIEKAEPLAWVVDARDGEMLNDRDGDRVDCLIFYDQQEARDCAQSDEEGVEDRTIEPLVRGGDVPALCQRVRELEAERDERDALLAKAVDVEAELLACLRTTVYAIRHCHGYMELVDWARVRRALGEPERTDDE